jgi:GDP-L-fucose synthase
VGINHNKILITGGSGMVGAAMKAALPAAMYPTRQELDLLNPVQVREFFAGNNIEAVIHLAAKVGGVKANTEYVGDFFTENIRMNTNLLEACAKTQVKKVVSLLSTCVYPDSVSYPITEDQLHNGAPHDSNYGYAYAKRMLDVQSRAYRQQYGCNFICAVPNNLYGENDNYDLENGHVIPALMRRIWEAKINNRKSVEVWGTGAPLREFTYSADIAQAILFLLDKYDLPEPINIGHTGEHSIKEVVNILVENLGYDGKIEWNTDKPCGQMRKPSSNQTFTDLGWDPKQYCDIRNGLKRACKWFKMNYPQNTRGVS